MKSLEIAALILVITGGLNWGFIGMFDLDLIAVIFGKMSVMSRMVYSLVGLSALYSISSLLKTIQE